MTREITRETWILPTTRSGDFEEVRPVDRDSGSEGVKVTPMSLERDPVEKDERPRAGWSDPDLDE